MRKSLLALGVMAATATMGVNAADYSDGDIHKNDYKWMQFNLMYAFDELPGESNHDYLEMEFGGRSGIFDLYGYVDIFNLTNSSSSDKKGNDKMFMKFAPRVSLDALTGMDLSFGPVQEMYFATLHNWGGNDGSTNNNQFGIGADVQVPWFGKVGLNLYKYYDTNNKEWNGYQISTNWFKPFYSFDNGSFLSYQGYIDYQFGMDTNNGANESKGGAMFNGLYWHSDQYALGYGLKLYKDVYGISDSKALKSTGAGQYISATYKF